MGTISMDIRKLAIIKFQMAGLKERLPWTTGHHVQRTLTKIQEHETVKDF